MNTDIQLEIKSEPRLLQTVRALVSAYMSSYGFSVDRCYELTLAVDEACTNVLRHAYGGATEHRYHLSLAHDDTWVQVELSDQGTPAPREKVQKKKLVTPNQKEDITPGGLGVQLIYEVFEEVQFAIGADAGNCVRMRARRPDTLKKDSLA